MGQYRGTREYGSSIKVVTSNCYGCFQLTTVSWALNHLSWSIDSHETMDHVNINKRENCTHPIPLLYIYLKILIRSQTYCTHPIRFITCKYYYKSFTYCTHRNRLLTWISTFTYCTHRIRLLTWISSFTYCTHRIRLLNWISSFTYCTHRIRLLTCKYWQPVKKWRSTSVISFPAATHIIPNSKEIRGLVIVPNFLCTFRTLFWK